MKEIEVIVDTREHNHELIKYLSDYNNVVIRRKALEVVVGDSRDQLGDLEIGHANIELKRADDFLSSAISGRLEEQIISMHLHCELPVLLVYRKDERTYRLGKLDYSKIEEWIATFNFMVPTYYFDDLEMLVDFVIRKSKHFITGEGFTSLKRPVRIEKENNPLINIVTWLPGIRRERAIDILEYSDGVPKSIEKPFKKWIRSWKGIKGIGDKTIKKALEVWE